MKVHKQCVPNTEDRCTQCRGRRMSMKKKRVCPLYSLLKKSNPVELYEYFATETEELRKRIEELESVFERLALNPRQF